MSAKKLAVKLSNCRTVELSSSVELFGSERPGLPLLKIHNQHCKAIIAFQGAHLVSYAPLASDELLWLSTLSNFKQGVPIRGGVPVCMPWFGVNQHDVSNSSSSPKHGFLRDRDWQLEKVSERPEGTRLTFSMRDFDQQAHALFPYQFTALLTFEFGKTLQLSLELCNLSAEPMPLSYAFHSYHPVADLSQVALHGLHGLRYLDNTNDLKEKYQEGVVRFDGELDRVYLDVEESQTVELKKGYQLKVEAEACDSCIVWNPGAKVAEGMADVGLAQYPDFICIERGNAFDNELMLAQGEVHKSHLCLSLTALSTSSVV